MGVVVLLLVWENKVNSYSDQLKLGQVWSLTKNEVNSHSVQLNVELDLQVGEEFDNIPHSLHSSPSIELKLLVSQYETLCLCVLVDNDCCTP